MDAKQLTDEVFQIIQSNTSPKVSELIKTIKTVENYLSSVLNSEYKRGFEAAKKEWQQNKINRQIKEN